MARKTPARNKKGQFKKGGRKTTRKRKATTRKRRRNPAPARRRRAPAKRRRAPARARRRAPAKRRRARRNPARKMNPLWEAIVAGAVAAGADVLIDNFIAPQWPRAAAWGSPILKVAGGWWLHDQSKMKAAGAGLMAIGAAELATALISAGQMMLGGAPVAAVPSQAWANWGGNFPRGQTTHPLSNPNTLENYAASRRVTDPVPSPAAAGFGNGYYGGIHRANMAQAL